MVHLPRLIVLLVDRGDLDGEQKTHRPAATHGQATGDALLEFRSQSEQPRLGRHQRLAQLRSPGGVCEVSGAQHGDALARSPPREVLEVAVTAAGPGVLGVYVQVRIEHRRPYPFRPGGRAPDPAMTAARSAG